MNVEQLDGFFAALIAGPEMVNAERVTSSRLSVGLNPKAAGLANCRRKKQKVPTSLKRMSTLLSIT